MISGNYSKNAGVPYVSCTAFSGSRLDKTICFMHSFQWQQANETEEAIIPRETQLTGADAFEKKKLTRKKGLYIASTTMRDVRVLALPYFPFARDAPGLGMVQCTPNCSTPSIPRGKCRPAVFRTQKVELMELAGGWLRRHRAAQAAVCSLQAYLRCPDS